MKFTLDAREGINLIQAYAIGEVKIREHVVRTNCIVTADTLVTDWKATSPDDLDLAHFEQLFELQPEVVLLGTGEKQIFPPASVRKAFASRRIGLETMDLGGACRTFNILVQEERQVAAALFLTIDGRGRFDP